MELSIYFDELLGRSIPGRTLTNDLKTFLREMRRTPSGPLIISKLLANKIQSKNETIALRAFDFLEAALETEVEGSIEFRTEIGRYRFLNEIIRILSPKYLGTTTPNAVRERAINFLQSAAGLKRRKWFPSEFSKVDTVYRTLVEGGVIHQISENEVNDPDADFRKNIFERGENAVVLKKLLQSKDPNDLQAANRLIKNLVEEEARRNERRSELHSLIDRIETSTSLLCEMLNQPNVSDFEVIEELVETCNTLRGKLGDIRSETNEETTSLVQASENIEATLELYEKRKKEPVTLLQNPKDIMNDSETDSNSMSNASKNIGMSLVDQLLMGMDLNLAESENSKRNDMFQDNLLNFDVDVDQAAAAGDCVKLDMKLQENKLPIFDELNKMSRDLMEKSLASGTQIFKPTEPRRIERTTLSELQRLSNAYSVNSVSPSSNHCQNLTAQSQTNDSSSADEVLDLDYFEKSGRLGSNHKCDHFSGSIGANANCATAKVNSSAEDENLLGLDLDEVSNISSYSTNTTLPLPPSSPQNNVNSNPVEHKSSEVQSPVPAQSRTSNFQLSSIKDAQLDIEEIELIDNLNPVDVGFDKNIHLTITFGHFPDKLPKVVKAAVITVTNKNTSMALLNYVFQLLPPKGTQVKLLPPSRMELPQWKKTFLPSPILTQLALFVVPSPKAISSQPSESATLIKYILSYCLDDETVVHNESFALPYY